MYLMSYLIYYNITSLSVSVVSVSLTLYVMFIYPDKMLFNFHIRLFWRNHLSVLKLNCNSRAYDLVWSNLQRIRHLFMFCF